MTAAARLRAASRTPTAAGLVATVAMLTLLGALRAGGALQPLELAAYDGLLALRASGAEPDPRVIQVSVTEADLNRFTWPLPDQVLADAIDRLHAAGARAIGIDIFRPSPIEPGAQALARTLAATPELVWVNRFSQSRMPGILAPAAMETGGRAGFADLVLDAGGVARRGLLYLSEDSTVAEALPLKLATVYLAHEGIHPSADAAGFLRLGPTSLPAFAGDTGGYRDVDTRGYQILREFRNGATLSTLTLADVMDGAAPLPVAGKLVLVGVVADSVKDSVISPLGRQPAFGLPGVTLHGLFASQLLGHALDHVPPTRPVSGWLETALIAICVAAAGVAGTKLRSGAHLAACAFGGGAVIVGLASFAFFRAVWLPVVPMAGGWMLTAALSGSVVAFVEKQQHALLMRLFSAAVSAPVARELWRRRDEFISGGRPVPVRLSATVVFADINDFTVISEALEPDALVRWLDLYMQEMAQLVGEHLGIISGFVGDGLMAVFGVPIARQSAPEILADAVAATNCALRIQAALRPLNETYAREGLPPIRAAVGIHSGVVVACSLGTTDRQQYTVIGDPANTASRLVQVAKERMRGTSDVCLAVIGEPTRDLVHDEFDLQPIGLHTVKGKSHDLQCYLVTASRKTG